MKYPPAPLVTELTLPIFFWLCLPYVLILVVMVIWLWLLLKEEEMLLAEETKKQSAGVPQSDSGFEDEPIDDEDQNDSSSTEFQEDIQSLGPVGKPGPKPASLSSKLKSQKQTAISNIWSQNQKIRSSHVEKSVLCNIMMLLCTTLCSLTWNFLSQLLQICNVLRIQLLPSPVIVNVVQLFDVLCENVVKILSSLRLESRGLLTSILGTRYKRTGTE